MPENRRKTDYATDPHPGESEEDVVNRLRHTFDSAKSGEMGKPRQQLLADEITVLGLPEESTADTFWPAHQELAERMDRLIADVQNESKQVVADSLSSRLADDVRSKKEIQELLSNRLSSVWTEVNDSWRYAEQPIRTVLAAHNGAHRSTTLNLSSVISVIKRDGWSETDLREHVAQISRHETMHAAFASWYDPERSGTGVVSNGISIAPRSEGDDWLNEGTIEKYRRDNFGSDKFGFSYEASVAVLDAADALDPGFEDERLKVAVFNENRGTMIGRLESIFGPMAFESIQQLIAGVKKAEDLHGFREEVVGMLAENNRDRAREVIDTVIKTVEARASIN